MTDRRLTMTEALAMELRWMEHLAAAHPHARPSRRLTRNEVWARCSRVLQDMYRADARHLLAVIEPYRRRVHRKSDMADQEIRDGRQAG